MPALQDGQRPAGPPHGWRTGMGWAETRSQQDGGRSSNSGILRSPPRAGFLRMTSGGGLAGAVISERGEEGCADLRQ